MSRPAPSADRAPRGRLVLVPNALDHGCETVAIEDVLARGVLARAAGLRHWLVEDARSARAFLKRVDSVVPLGCAIQAVAVRELPRPQKGGKPEDPRIEAVAWLQPALDGHDIGLLSEAGMPAIADPGAAVVAAAHRAGIPVEALPGPSALLLALAASGFGGQSFAFAGYLPQDALARVQRLRELESASRRLRQAQLFIETPYRNQALLDAMLGCLAPATRVAVTCGATLPDGWSRSGTVQEWQGLGIAMPARVPAVFALLAR